MHLTHSRLLPQLHRQLCKTLATCPHVQHAPMASLALGRILAWPCLASNLAPLLRGCPISVMLRPHWCFSTPLRCHIPLFLGLSWCCCRPVPDCSVLRLVVKAHASLLRLRARHLLPCGPPIDLGLPERRPGITYSVDYLRQIQIACSRVTGKGDVMSNRFHSQVV